MESKEWKQLIEQHEAAILATLRKAYAETCLVNGNLDGWKIDVILSDTGNVYLTDPLTASTTDGDVWTGKHLHIARADFWNVGNTEISKREFEEWLDEPAGDNWTEHPKYDEFLTDCRDGYIEAFADDWAEKRLAESLRNLDMAAEYEKAVG